MPPRNSLAAKAAAPASQRSKLKRKIVATFCALVLLFGLFVTAIVYLLTGQALRAQIALRAAALATNLSDAAAGYVAKKSALELAVLIAKYGRLDGVAYAYIQDPGGVVLSSSLQPFPQELKKSPAVNNRRTPGSRTTQLRGRSVEETYVPLLDGQLGTVHIGLWTDSVERQVNSTVLTIIGLIGVCLLVSIAAGIVYTRRAIGPILQLKVLADDISRGELDTEVDFQSDDEIGDIARSLERMRASLKAAMSRLNKL